MSFKKLQLNNSGTLHLSVKKTKNKKKLKNKRKYLFWRMILHLYSEFVNDIAID